MVFVWSLLCPRGVRGCSDVPAHFAVLIWDVRDDVIITASFLPYFHDAVIPALLAVETELRAFETLERVP